MELGGQRSLDGAIPIDRPDDPRIVEFLGLRDHDLRRRREADGGSQRNDQGRSHRQSRPAGRETEPAAGGNNLRHGADRPLPIDDQDQRRQQ